jgi:predicted nucleic acid-binding protein
MVIHLDTDFLIYALSQAGAERDRLRRAAESDVVLQISAVAWYEFSRGPRTPEQIAVARALFGADGIVPFTETLAVHAADTFRRLGSPRRRAADIAIGVTAAAFGALLLTRNARDFAGIADLELDAVVSK